MDKLVQTKTEKRWNREAWERDRWVEAEARKLKPGSRVLDAGAGASKYRPFFPHCKYETQDFCQYEGPLVKYLQPVDYVCDVAKIPLPNASLDAILCTEVIEHVTDPMAAVGEFARLLKPGGTLLLTAPASSYLHMEPYHFYGGFTEYWYRHWLPRLGFEIETIAPQGGPGRSAVLFLDGLNINWRAWEKSLPQPARVLSTIGRLLLMKIPTYYFLPWLFGRLDSRLNRMRIPVGLLVTAKRKNSEEQQTPESPQGRPG